MRNFKKVLAIVLATMLVVPAMSFGSFASDNAAQISEDWRVDSVSAVSTVADADFAYVSSDDPITNSALTVTYDHFVDLGYDYDPVTGADVPGTSFIVTAEGADVNGDEELEYPSAITFMWTTAPEKRADVNKVNTGNYSNHNPFGGTDTDASNRIPHEHTLAITIADYSYQSDYNFPTVPENQPGDNTANLMFYSIWGGNFSGYGWGDSFRATQPIDLSQPIEVSSYCYFDDEMNSWQLYVTINGEEYEIPGYAGAFNGEWDDNKDENGNPLADTPSNSDGPIYKFVVGATTTKFGADNNYDYAIGGLNVEVANSATTDGHIHVFDDWTVAIPNTCTEYGTKTATCAYCDLTSTISFTELEPHAWDNGVITRQATCNKTEKTLYTCLNCLATEERTTGEKLPHNYYDIEDERNVPATCTTDGVQIQECDQRTPHHQRTLTIPALGHNVESWTLVDAGNCITPSVEEGVCTRCQQTIQRQGEVSGHDYEFVGVHAGASYEICSVCGDKQAVAISDLDAEGNIVDDGDNYVSAGAVPVIVENGFWTATGVNADGTDLGIGDGYNNYFVTGIDGSGNIFIKDEAQFFNDQPAASRAQSLIVSKFPTHVDGFTTAITPLECLGDSNGFTKFAQNYSVLFTNHPELYRDGKLVTQGFEGFIRSDDGVTHPADEMSFEIVIWNGNLQDNVTYLFVPSVVNGVVDAAINTMTALSAPVDLTQNVTFGVSTEDGLKVYINGVEYGSFATAAAAADGWKYVGYQAGNSFNAAQYRIMSARFVIAEINGAAGTATWFGDDIGHQWGEWEVTTPGTCAQKEILSRTCALCGETETEEGNYGAEHDYQILGIHEGLVYLRCTGCGDTYSEEISSVYDVASLADAESYGDGNLENDFWTVSVNNKVGTNMGIGAGYDDWMFVTIDQDGNLQLFDTNFAFRDYPATAAANERAVSKFAADINGFTASIVPVPCWIDEGAALKFPYAQNYSFFWTNSPDAYRDAETGVSSRGFIKDGSNYGASDRSLEVLFADTNYDLVADKLVVTATFMGTAYPFEYDINVPFADNELEVEIINTATEFAVIAEGTRYDFNDMIGVLSGDLYFGVQASTDWTNNAAVRALSTDFTLASINGAAETASWHGAELPHQWGEWVIGETTKTHTCELCGATETEDLPVVTKAYVLTFDANGGTIDGEASISFPIDYMETYRSATGWTELHEPVREGYTFDGWSYLGVYYLTANALDDQYGLQSDGTFVAEWIENTPPTPTKDYVVTFNANGGLIEGEPSLSFGINNGESYESATGWATVPTPVREGYEFDGWCYLDYNYYLNNMQETYGVTWDAEFTAQWVEAAPPAKDYVVTFNANGGLIEGEASKSFGINYGESYESATGWATVPTPVRDGYDFDGWCYVDYNYYLNNMQETYGVTWSAEFTAQWVEAAPAKAYTLTFDANGGTIDGESSISFGIDYMETYRSATGWTELHYPVREGYVFLWWDYNNLGGVYGLGPNNLDDTYNVQDNASFVAQWRERNPYDLTFDANGGTIDGEASLTFDINTGMTYAAATGWDKIHVPVREGYYFDGWNYAGVYTLGSLQDEYGLSSDGTFVAQWRQITSKYIDTTNHGFTNNPQFVGSYFDTAGLSPKKDRLTMYYGFAEGDPVKVDTLKVGDLRYFLEDGTEIFRYDDDPTTCTYFTDDMIGEHTITLVPIDEDYAEFTGTVTLTIAPVPKDYVVTFDANGGLIEGEPSLSFGINNGESYESATGWATVPTPVREGYEFDGWCYLDYNYYLNNMQETYGVTWDAAFTAQWIKIPAAELAVDGLNVTVTDADGLLRDAILVGAEYTGEADGVYKWSKTLKAEGQVYYYRISANRLAANENAYTLYLTEPGVYTLIYRYNDASKADEYKVITLVGSGTATVDIDGDNVTVTAANVPVKAFRYALGEGLTTVRELKAAEGYTAVAAKYFTENTYAGKIAVEGTYSWIVEFVDGTIVCGEFTVAGAPVPTITSTTISNWGEVLRIKYAPGELTTSADFRAAACSVARRPAEGDFTFAAELTGTYSFQCIYSDGTTRVVTLTF